MNILIAEDDLTSRTVLSRVLQLCGHQVTETSNGQQAWQLLQQADSPRLVILDWMMPEMDGPEVLRRIRSLQTDRPPYVIMLTAKGNKADLVAGLDGGANDYLAKPFDPDELRARVEVGERMVEMQLQLHRYRVNAQCIRVENDRKLLELQDALAAKTDELRRAHADVQILSARLHALL